MIDRLRRALSRPQFLILLICCAGPAWLARSQDLGPVQVEQSSVRSFADDLLDGASGQRGGLDVTAALVAGSEVEGEDGSIAASLDAAVRLPPDWAGGREPHLTLVAYDLDDEPLMLQEAVTLAEPAGAAWWVYRRVVLLPEEFLEAVLVVEDLASGRRGGSRVGYGEPLAPPPPPTPAATQRGGVIVDQLEPLVRARPVAVEAPPSVLRLVPPRGNSQTGRVRIRTLLTTDEIARVSFSLDGGPAKVDDDEPFVLEIDLGPEARTREVIAIAYSAGDRELGRDRLLLNSRLELLDVRMTLSSAAVGESELGVEAAVTVPREATLDRVEFYLNEELLETQKRGPFVAKVSAAGLGASDYLRAVAYLTDGSSLDDVRLLADADSGTRIDVNLVQVFAVASARDGEPVTDLTADDFDVRVGKRKVEIERFERAVDVPLSLGLVFDTSGSMYALMPDAKQAGASFLGSIIREQDRAFLIDFDTRPRLAHPLTTDLGSLLRRFGQLEAKGKTALYDAVVFGMLQFDKAPGRRLLVVLTDGVPSGSKFGARQCIDLAVEQAVPIYSIDLSGVLGRVAGAKLPLVGLAKASGGRVHTIMGDPTGMGDYEAVSRALQEAYGQIERELRSQYVMAFSTPKPLTAEEIKSVKVKVERSGVKVRRVVGTLTG